ncbi:MAG: hypothetical protein J6V72_20075, partial [Kiritimatiellae bacterium]|nr:hypothetical protein [Kiritimatiellia bacterium]
MNMKKTIGVCATLLAAFLCVVPQSAKATGKIRSVDVYDPNGRYTFPNAGNAMTVGDTVHVRFRLVNPCWAESEANPSLTYPWEFFFTGTVTGNETYDQLQQLAAAKPRLGLWISGCVREAEYVGQLGTASDWPLDDNGNPAIPSGAKHYTDLIFKYTVQKGDLALPIQLANASGTGPATGAEPYYFKYNGSVTQWRLECATAGVERVVADFAFGPPNLDDDPVFHGTDLSTWEMYVNDSSKEIRDFTLLNAGAYVQALDFDNNYDDQNADIWRTIAQGSTTAEPGAPAIAIAGGAAEPMDLYIWTADTNIAEIVKGGQVQEVKPCVFSDGETRTVGKIHITAGSENVPFSVKATGNVGETTQVYLSNTPTNILNASGDVINNFISRTVKVGEALPPSISVKLGAEKADKLTITANANHAQSQLSINLELTAPYGSELEIPVKVTMLRDPSLDVREYVGLSWSETGERENLSWNDTIRIPAGSVTASASDSTGRGVLYMYANRGNADTQLGLLVEVNTNELSRLYPAAMGYFTGKFKSAIVYIKPSTPEIVSGLPAITDAEANMPKEITIKVADAYGELHDPCRYKVYWSRSGGVSASDYVVTTNLAATADGDLTFSVTYTQPGEYTSRFYVENQDGKKSDPLDPNATVSVTVKAQKLIKATTLQQKFPEDGFNEQPIVTLDFGADGFSMPNGEPEGFIFFVPRSTNAADLVDCADFNIDNDNRWKAGYSVYAGATSVGPIQMTLLDGNTKGITMGYDIIVRTAEYWDEGEIVSSWNSQGFSFGVTNVVPEVTQVSMSGTRLSVNGGTMSTHASLNVSKVFTAQTSEPSDLDLYADDPNYADDQKAFTTEWSFDYGSGAPVVKYVYGPPSTPLTNAFTQAGTCTVTVRMCDKDMDHNRGVFGPEFTFTVIVDDKPAVTLSPASGLNTFHESHTTADYGTINVGLSMPPPTEVTVHLEVTRAPGVADDGNYPLPVLSKYDVPFAGGATEVKPVFFTWLDGTALSASDGFVITATVTNTTENADGVELRNLYTPASREIYVVNDKPKFYPEEWNSDTNYVSKGQILSVRYTVRDVPADMAAPGLTMTLTTSEGFYTNYQVSATGRGQYVSYNGSSPTFSFSSPGLQTMTLTVEDKEHDDISSRTWIYFVNPSKTMMISPRDLTGDYRTELSDYYMGAAGRGQGRVWVKDGALTDVQNFVHEYGYAPSKADDTVYARGYKVGDVDNGGLTPGKDIAIDGNGNHNSGGAISSYYTYDDSRFDSFFYCWLVSMPGEGGGGSNTGGRRTGALLSTFQPEVKTTDLGGQQVTLDDKEVNNEESIRDYDTTFLDAIFSKEYLASDNVGDINKDGIPDVFAVNKTYENGKLYAFASGAANGGDTGEDAASSAVDVKTKLAKFNDDGDFLPADYMATGNILPTADAWNPLGEAFRAEWEIRGFHEGLNYRVKDSTVDGSRNYNVSGAWISEPMFSPAESNAIVYMNKKLGIHEFTWPVDPTNAEHVANWRTGLNKDNSWIPENRTDPTVDDTDEDGFPDGYEYYFWYYAQVGWIDGDGNWKRLEGEKFQLDNIAKGVPLTADEIAEAFNPTIAAKITGTDTIEKRDTDGDGLSDLEELAAGTNPVHWDTDGDGMSDLWEILRGLDPLKKDAGANPDGDYMALVDLSEDYAILTFTTNKVTEIWALPNNGNGFVDPDTSVILPDATGTAAGVKVYRYGDDKSPW